MLLQEAIEDDVVSSDEDEDGGDQTVGPNMLQPGEEAQAGSVLVNRAGNALVAQEGIAMLPTGTCRDFKLVWRPSFSSGGKGKSGD